MQFAPRLTVRIKTTLGLLLLLSTVVGFLCISFAHAIPVHTHSTGETSFGNCCSAGADNHMELWKSTFVGIPQGLQEILVLIVLVGASAGIFSDFFRIPRLNVNILFLKYTQYARAHPNIRVFDTLRLAFARGILHPKIH